MAPLLAFSGCFSLLRLPETVEADWQRTGPSRFLFSDRDMDVLFEVGADRTFRWRIRNRTQVTLRMEQAKVTLHRENDPVAYSMWGEPLADAAPNQMLVIEPGRFVSLSFPVRYASEWFPFKVPPERRAWVEIEARWGRQDASYRLVFPPDPVTAPSDG